MDPEKVSIQNKSLSRQWFHPNSCYIDILHNLCIKINTCKSVLLDTTFNNILTKYSCTL